MPLSLTVSPVSIIAIIGILTAPLLSYIAAARKMSGKVNTSEASELWAESKAMRADYRESGNIAALRTNELEKRINQLERDNNTLAKENIDLLRKNMGYETTIAALEVRLKACEDKFLEVRKEEK